MLAEVPRPLPILLLFLGFLIITIVSYSPKPHSPRNLTRRCPSPRDFDVQLLNTWSAQYDSMLTCIDEIVAKLS